MTLGRMVSCRRSRSWRPASGSGRRKRRIRMLRVRDSMTREVVTLGPEASAAEAWGVCQELGIRHLPIIEGGSLVGLVSDRDLRDISPPRGSGGERDTLGWVRLKIGRAHV